MKESSSPPSRYLKHLLVPNTCQWMVTASSPIPSSHPEMSSDSNGIATPNNSTSSAGDATNVSTHNDEKKKKLYDVVFVLGPPGSGKGTQCQRIEKKFGFVHLSAGDLLRAERERKGSLFGDLIETHIRNGTIVPVEITCKLLENAMDAQPDALGFLVDGFPRNQNNLEGWKKEMDDKVHVHFVLYLSAPIEICVGRCLNRGQNRADDNQESMQKRVTTYNSQTLPIIQHYAAKSLVREISSTQTPDEVYAAVEKVFKDASFKPIC